MSNTDPFLMSFEEIKAQADANMRADKAGQEPASEGAGTTGATFLDMVNAAERKLASKETDGGQGAAKASEPAGASAPIDLNFDEMFAQAQSMTQSGAGTAGSPTGRATGSPAAGATGSPAGTELNFDDMFAQAQAAQAQAAQAAQASVTENAYAEHTASSQQDTVAETPPALDISFDGLYEAAGGDAAAGAVSFDAIADMGAAMPKPTAEEPKAEEPKASGASKKSSGKKNAKKKDEEPKEPLPDTTEEYKVDLNQETGRGEDKPAEAAASVQEEPAADAPSQVREVYPSSMMSLFTKEEIKALRETIRTFVRREIKLAMVGAMNDLLSEFSETK